MKFENLTLAAKLNLVLTIIMLVMSVALAFALSGYLTNTLQAHSMEELKKTNRVVVDMIDAYNSSLEQAAGRLGNLFSSYFPDGFALDERTPARLGGEGTPVLRCGSVVLNLHFDEVDRFNLITGGVATIFARQGDDFVRIATSLRKENGERATGTLLRKTHPGYAKLNEGQPYVGKAHLFGKDYMTKYMPIKSSSGKVIGILFIGVDFTVGLKGLKEKIRGIRVGETGYLYVLDAGKDMGMLVVHPTQEGMNLIGAKDADGRGFVREMLDRKDGIIDYPWIDASLGEKAPRDKVAVFNFYPQWDWIVASSGYLDEFTAASRKIRNILIAALLGFVVVLVGVIQMASRIWVGKPLEMAVGDVERLAGGDLSQSMLGRRAGQDEIGRLLTAMECMRINLHDMIQKIRANAELEAVNERLRNLDKLKSDFLSSVSHELRTPLTSIRGFSQLIEREFTRSFVPLAGENAGLLKKSARIQDNLQIILKESERLTRLINDFLDLAKIESGRTDWHDAPMQVATFMQDVANAVHGMFEHKPEVEFRVEIAEGLPMFVGDADRMQQVLINLINNAVKFTDQGNVTVAAFLNSEQLIQLEVRDTGIGFPPDEAEAIFDKFQQAKHGDTLLNRPKGTGLGLAICREILAHHHGRIWAQSRPGEGSVFTLVLPPAVDELTKAVAITSSIAAFADTDKLSEDTAPAAKAGKRKALVVDDDPGVRDYFRQLLEEQDFEVITAADGQAALTAAKSVQPDLITMDLSMPVMDGRTAIALLRADPALKRIPIMVISAIPGKETAGGDMAMSKPLDETRFVANIHSLLADTSAASAPDKKLRFLVLYEEGQSRATVPGNFSVHCEVGFCPIGELVARIQAGFQGMVAIPADLLNRVDIGFLNAAPALEVMIMPVTPAGINPSIIGMA